MCFVASASTETSGYIKQEWQASGTVRSHGSLLFAFEASMPGTLGTPGCISSVRLSEDHESAPNHSHDHNQQTLHFESTSTQQQNHLHSTRINNPALKANLSHPSTLVTDPRHLSRSHQRNTSLCQSKTSRPSVSDLAATTPQPHHDCRPHDIATQPCRSVSHFTV